MKLNGVGFCTTLYVVYIGICIKVHDAVGVCRPITIRLKTYCMKGMRYCLPLTYIIHQRRLLYWKKCLFSDNVLLQTLARCCHDNILVLCVISINSLLKILLIYRNILSKNCSGKSMSGRISCDSV